jgi:hypothetical protein
MDVGARSQTFCARRPMSPGLSDPNRQTLANAGIFYDKDSNIDLFGIN